MPNPSIILEMTDAIHSLRLLEQPHKGRAQLITQPEY
jgi:hypothetical protein